MSELEMGNDKQHIKEIINKHKEVNGLPVKTIDIQKENKLDFWVKVKNCFSIKYWRIKYKNWRLSKQVHKIKLAAIPVKNATNDMSEFTYGDNKNMKTVRLPSGAVITSADPLSVIRKQYPNAVLVEPLIKK